jgi:hypothetical protein
MPEPERGEEAEYNIWNEDDETIVAHMMAVPWESAADTPTECTSDRDVLLKSLAELIIESYLWSCQHQAKEPDAGRYPRDKE